MFRLRTLSIAAFAAPVIASAQATATSSRASELPLKHAPRPTSPAITPADLMTRLYIFADDSMQGRETSTEGNRRALRYIESELTRLGLTPMGDKGSFLQEVPLVKRGWNSEFTVSAGGTALGAWTDVVPLPPRGAKPRTIDGAAVIYGGTIEEATKSLTAEQAAGKIVVIRSTGSARAPRITATSPLVNAAGIALFTGTTLSPQFVNFYRTPGVSLPDAQGATQTAPVTLIVSANALQAIFGTEPTALTPGQAGKPLSTTLAFSDVPAPAYNVVAMLAGSDPALKGQVVSLGAHNDHVGFNRTPVNHDSLRAFQRVAWKKAGAYAGLPPLNAEQRASISVNMDSLRALRPARMDSIANGADDDGSGSMAVLEIAEQLSRARVKPKRSILFVWHTGEEKGLLGSRWISEHLPVTRDSIVAQINIDMIGRGDSVDVDGGGPTYVGVVGAKRLSSMLGATVDSLAKANRTPIALDYRMDSDGHPENIYCRSDHYNYARWGIPVAFFFTGLHGDYHQVTDEPQYVDYKHYSLLANYISDLLVTVSNGAKPVVDKPKPDPNGQCRQ
ncbi:MAG TPA: M20/M25/M40 family metallo-hydrolase [Gemmatimonadaceae bacterium]|nr:M20/M25/M40 family metallo-hydrolase [Gemmatimonadaceae bacterium]